MSVAAVPPPHEVRTWAEICDGDRIALPRESDGAGRHAGYEVVEVARAGRLASVRPTDGPWSPAVTPPADAPAARTMRGPVSVAVDMLRAGGLDVELIEQ